MSNLCRYQAKVLINYKQYLSFLMLYTNILREVSSLVLYYLSKDCFCKHLKSIQLVKIVDLTFKNLYLKSYNIVI